MPTDRSGWRLVRGSAARATAWLECAYARHGLAVSSYAYHLTGDREEAERLTASVFEEAHRRRLGGRAVRRPRVWLLRRLHTTAPILPRDRRGGLVRQLPEHDARELTALRGQIWRLPLDQQGAFVLSHWCGLRPWDVARVLGLPARQVRVALRQAEAAMGEEFAPAARRRGAAVAVGASMAVTAAQVRAGGSKALAATVPGFGGGASTAAGAGSIPLVAAAGKVAVAAVVAATATVAGAVVEHHVGSLGGRPHVASPSVTAHHAVHGSTPRQHTPAPSGGSQPARKTPTPLPKRKPSRHSKPGRPSTPVHGSGSGHPTPPSHPSHPTHPSHPSHPTHPSKPHKPHKQHPTHPTHPSKPHKPHATHPTHPTHPAKPDKPGKSQKQA
jgi:DNA-directed RNA polymerase specialized sigma24 family protein